MYKLDVTKEEFIKHFLNLEEDDWLIKLNDELYEDTEHDIDWQLSDTYVQKQSKSIYSDNYGKLTNSYTYLYSDMQIIHGRLVFGKCFTIIEYISFLNKVTNTKSI